MLPSLPPPLTTRPDAAFKDLCLDAVDPALLGAFWGALLGLAGEVLDDGDVVLRGATPQQTIWVNAVPEPRPSSTGSTSTSARSCPTSRRWAARSWTTRRTPG